MKLLRRVIAFACIVLGLLLVSRTSVLERRYAATMPRERDVFGDRTLPMIVNHGTRVYVNDAEAKTLDAAKTYFTFGWPFVILGILLAVASREPRVPFEPLTDNENRWTDRL